MILKKHVLKSNVSKNSSEPFIVFNLPTFQVLKFSIRNWKEQEDKYKNKANFSQF